MKRLFTFLLTVLALALPAFANLTFGPVTANGATAVQVIYPTLLREARLVEIRSTGTFDGASLVVETRARGTSTWIAKPTAITAAGVTYMYVVNGDDMRITASSVGASTSVTVLIR